MLEEVPVPANCPQGMQSFCVKANSGITQLTAGANMAHDTTQFVCHASSPIQPDRTLSIDLELSCGKQNVDSSLEISLSFRKKAASVSI